MKSGIYAIINIVNRRIYIGQAQDIFYRWSYHKSALKYGYHHSQKLQRAYNKYGEKNFKFMIIEYGLLENLNFLEQKWIDFTNAHKNGYNCQPLAGTIRGFKFSSFTKRKMKENAIRISSNPEERKRRSERAKLQHQQGKFGRQTWSKETEKIVSKKLSNIMNKEENKFRLKNHIKQQSSEEMSRRSYQRKIFK